MKLSSLALAGAAVASLSVAESKLKLVESFGFLRAALALKKRIDAGLKDNTTLVDIIEATVDRVPNKPAIVYVNTNESWTFRALDEAANRVAHWALTLGLKCGDIVALLMTNRPEFVAVWYGLAKVGVIASFINTNLSGPPLTHSITVCTPRAIVFEESLRGSLTRVWTNVQEACPSLIFASLGSGPYAGVGLDTNLTAVLPSMPTHRPSPLYRVGVTLFSPWSLIYTSGTTGMPKAAPVPQFKMLSIQVFYILSGMTPEDVLYVCLPLYHSTASLLGTGLSLVNGLTLVLRDKFSATRFWNDVTDFKATVSLYIGELCRYLLLAKANPAEKTHKLKLVIGNGLRPDIWEDFQSRFNIPTIFEFYGATESNVAFFNFATKPEHRGCIGRWTLLHRLLKTIEIVKVDEDTGDLVRGPDGLCIPVAACEPGEALGLVDNRDPVSARLFSKYHNNEKATSGKIARDVRKKGDMYFRSGDLLKVDLLGRVLFVDRIGDTFRWKGENVATTEVAEVVSLFPGVAEANVYGVAVPGKDGRAGMAALTLKEGFTVPGVSGGEGTIFDVAGLAAHCAKNLPSYAVPVFLRFLPEVPITGTFKHQKVQLRKEGCDPTVVTDPLFWLAPESKAYAAFGAREYLSVTSSKL